MKTLFGLENKNKVSEKSPDYLVYQTLDGNPEEQQAIGIMYRSESKKGVEYLKIMMDGDDSDPETRKTYFCFMNRYKRGKTDPDWYLYVPKKDDNEKRKAVGSVFENTAKDGKLYFKITFFDDNSGNDREGVKPNKGKS